MKNNRKGEKWGWIGGWIGSFLWMPILGIVFVFKMGVDWNLVLVWFCSLTAFVLIFTLAPWRFPNTSMWRLMLPMYLLLIGGAAFLIRSYGNLSLKEWIPMIPGMLPVLLPFWLIGKRKWRDGEEGPPSFSG